MTDQHSIDNAVALYHKLERTYELKPDYGEYQIDWVFDLSVTAWHIVDWLAHETTTDIRNLQQCVKNKCPELVICEQICNGAKHLILNNPKLAPFDVTKAVSNTGARVGVSKGGRAGEKSFDIQLTPSISITDKDGHTWEALSLFRDVLRFWRQELSIPE